MAIFMNHHSVVFYFSLKVLKMLGLQKTWFGLTNYGLNQQNNQFAQKYVQN